MTKKHSGWLSGCAEERHWEWLGCHHQSSSQDGQSPTIFVSVLSNNILMARWGWVRGPQRNVVKRCISHYQQSIWKANLTNEQVFESSKRKSKGLLDKLVLAHMAQALMWLEPLKLLLLSSVPPKLNILGTTREVESNMRLQRLSTPVDSFIDQLMGWDLQRSLRWGNIKISVGVKNLNFHSWGEASMHPKRDIKKWSNANGLAPTQWALTILIDCAV